MDWILLRKIPYGDLIDIQIFFVVFFIICEHFILFNLVCRNKKFTTFSKIANDYFVFEDKSSFAALLTVGLYHFYFCN